MIGLPKRVGRGNPRPIVMKGYTLAFVKAVRQAPQDMLGVRLGRVCIVREIPVSEVARELKVSRPTIYSWFTGKSRPNWRQEEAITQYIKKLSA